MDVNEIMTWMQMDDWFTEVNFTGETDGVLYFTAKDDDGNNAEVSFEAEGDKIIVAARQSQDDEWIIVDILHPE
jgi:hypothetical protein